MTDKIEKDTKEKILESADNLFASLGFAGASVRQIASDAGVNLAAINYHFKSKENLYWEVFDYNHNLLNEGVHKIGKLTNSTEELAVGVFRFFISDNSAVLNTFKVFLSNNVSLPEESKSDDEAKEDFGPPGQEVFLEQIKKDLGKEIPLEEREWATGMIFSLIVHLAIISQTEVIKRKCKMSSKEKLNPDCIEEGLVMSVRAHLEFLKNTPSSNT